MKAVPFKVNSSNHLTISHMKRVFLFAALGLMCLAASCNSLDTPVTETGEGTLILSFTTGNSPVTKSDTNPSGKDATIHDIQAFLFLPDGSLYRRESLSGSELTKSLDRVKAGSYDIVAVANAPEMTSVQKKTDLEQASHTLSSNDPDKGFLMYGHSEGSVTVKSDAASPVKAVIAVKRYVGRVRLTSVENKLPAVYGALKVDCVFLENGFGTWNYGATGDPSDYVNYAGRKTGRNTSNDESDFIKNAADAECAALTFIAANRSVAAGSTETFGLPFYTLPNKVTAADDHFEGATSGDACTRLVLRVSYGDNGAQQWYYPVTIPNLERNKSYDVSFIISGPGVKDPNQRVSSGNLDVVISVDPWMPGDEYEGKF